MNREETDEEDEVIPVPHGECEDDVPRVQTMSVPSSYPEKGENLSDETDGKVDTHHTTGTCAEQPSRRSPVRRGGFLVACFLKSLKVKKKLKFRVPDCCFWSRILFKEKN